MLLQPAHTDVPGHGLERVDERVHRDLHRDSVRQPELLAIYSVRLLIWPGLLSHDLAELLNDVEVRDGLSWGSS